MAFSLKKRKMFSWSFLVFLLSSTQVFCDYSHSSNNNLINFNNNVVNEWLIPRLGQKHSLCNNHSKFYFEELQSLKLWATEMFDASAKFPSGVLYGSSYALGNFDECLDIKVPYQNEHFVGEYCMAKVTISPNRKYRVKSRINYEFGDYENFYNISAWSKMLDYVGEASKASRNVVYMSFCIPSSCTKDDLKESLTDLAEKINNESDFVLKIDVDKKHCQIKEAYHVSTGDVIFISILVFCVLVVLGCSLYDVFSRTEINCIRQAPEKYHKWLLCFSFPKNLKKLASKSTNDDGLDCLAGIKVISMFLIIFGHRCMFIFGSPVLNPIFLEKMYSRIEAAAILNGPIIVDTFFLISGFLASYLTLTVLFHSSSVGKIILIYVHRLIRMTPAYGIVLFFYCTVFISIGSGPFWQERIGVESERCLESWWANLIYVNNYVNVDELCMFQSWYLTCDMHYFLLVPLLVLLLKWRESFGIVAILILILASILTVVISVYIANEKPILLLYMKLLTDPIKNHTFRDIYIRSHMRASPYFLGVLMGYLKYKMKYDAFKVPTWITHIGWIMAFVFSLGTIHIGFVFYLPGFAEQPFFSAVYAGFHHFTFVLGISWLIIAISAGIGPWLEPILCWTPFVLLSRITFTAFLCHGAVQLYTSAIMRQPNYESVFTTLHAAFGDIVTAYTIGFIISMLFESPIMSIECIMFRKSKTETRQSMSSVGLESANKIATIKFQVQESPDEPNNNQTEELPKETEEEKTVVVVVDVTPVQKISDCYIGRS